MKKLLIFLALMLLPMLASSQIVNNSGTAYADSIGLPFFVLDSSGNMTNLTDGDSVFILVWSPGGSKVFRDTVTYNDALLDTAKISLTGTRVITFYNYHGYVPTLDGTTGRDGWYNYAIMCERDTGQVMATPFTGGFQLYQTRDFNAFADFVDAAITSRLAPTTAGRTLQTTTTGYAYVNIDSASGDISAAQIEANAIDSAAIATNALHPLALSGNTAIKINDTALIFSIDNPINLIHNGSFERLDADGGVADGWTVKTGDVTRVTKAASSGKYGIRLAGNGAAVGAMVSDSFYLLIGDKVQFGGKGLDHPTGGSAFIALMDGTDVEVATAAVNTGSTWQSFQGAWKVNDNDFYYLRVYRAGTTTADSFYVDDVFLNMESKLRFNDTLYQMATNTIDSLDFRTDAITSRAFKANAQDSIGTAVWNVDSLTAFSPATAMGKSAIKAGGGWGATAAGGDDSPSGWDATDTAKVRGIVWEADLNTYDNVAGSFGDSAGGWGATGSGSGIVVPIGYYKGWIDSLRSPASDYNFRITSAGGIGGVDLAAIDNAYNQWELLFVSGNFRGQQIAVLDFDTDTNWLYIDTMNADLLLTFTPALNDTFYIAPQQVVNVWQWSGYQITEAVQNEGVYKPDVNMSSIDGSGFATGDEAANNLRNLVDGTGHNMVNSGIEFIDTARHVAPFGIDDTSFTVEALEAIADRVFDRKLGKVTSDTIVAGCPTCTTDSSFFSTSFSSETDPDYYKDNMLFFFKTGVAVPGRVATQVARVTSFTISTGKFTVYPPFTARPNLNDSFVVFANLASVGVSPNALATLDSALISRLLHRIGWGTAQGSGSDSSTSAQRDIGLVDPDGIDSLSFKTDAITSRAFKANAEDSIASANADSSWQSLMSARSGVPGSFGDSSRFWGRTGASADLTANDSALISRIAHRVVWATSKSAGSDSSTLAERDVTTADILDPPTQKIANRVIIRKLGVVAAGATTAQFKSVAFTEANNYWNNNQVYFLNGTAQWQVARIDSFFAATDSFKISPSLSVAPSTGDSLVVFSILSEAQAAAGAGGDCIPGATITWTVYAVDSTGTPTAIPGVSILVKDAGGNPRLQGYTNSSGYTTFTVTTGTWNLSGLGGLGGTYQWVSRNKTVTGNQTDTLMGYDFSPSAPSSPDCAVVHGWVRSNGIPLKRARIVFSPPVGKANTCDSTLTFSQPVEAWSDANGYFEKCLVKSKCFDNAEYKVIVYSGETVIIQEQSFIVPDAASYRLWY